MRVVGRGMLPVACRPPALRQLGAVIAADMLVNNFDRSPLVWANEGNGNNLLVDIGVEPGVVRVTAIDQQCCPIIDEEDHQPLLNSYLERVRAATAEAVAGDAAGPHVAKVRDFIKKVSGGHDIGDDGCTHLLAGIKNGVAAVVATRNFVAPLEHTEQQFEAAGVDWGRPGMKNISLYFLERVATVMAEELESDTNA